MVKALYRPASFFRGFLFPLFNSPNLILKQAEIIGSLLSKRSFPNTHGAAAIFHCCGVEYSGILNIIFKALIEKKFCLPKVIIDKIFEWFVNFDKRPNIKKPLPVLWYQTFASFVKHYGRLFNSSFGRKPKKRTQKDCEVDISA